MYYGPSAELKHPQEPAECLNPPQPTDADNNSAITFKHRGPEQTREWIQHLRSIDARVNGTRAAQGTAEWLRRRDALLTASDYPAALKRSTFCSQGMLIKRKAGIIRPFEGNQFTLHGQQHENAARLLYEKNTGERVMEFGCLSFRDVYGGTDHPKASQIERYNFLGGSVDGITETGKLVEIKCPYKRDIGEGDVPDHYMDQVQGLMFVLDLPSCDFVQYKPVDDTPVNADSTDTIDMNDDDDADMPPNAPYPAPPYNGLCMPRPPKITIRNVKRDNKWIARNFDMLSHVWGEIVAMRGDVQQIQDAERKVGETHFNLMFNRGSTHSDVAAAVQQRDQLYATFYETYKSYRLPKPALSASAATMVPRTISNDSPFVHSSVTARQPPKKRCMFDPLE